MFLFLGLDVSGIVSLSVYGSLFLILSFFELYFAFVEKEKERKIIKPLLLLSLGILALMVVPDHYFLLLGIFLGMIGDIFFIFKSSRKCIYFGLLAFLFNHVFYILDIVLLFQIKILSVHVIILSIVYSLLLIVGFVLIRRILSLPLSLAILGSIYMTVLCLDLGFQVLSLLLISPYFLLGILGGIFFVVSDSILTFTLFVKDIKRRDFYIMSTYLLAQALLVSGYVLSALMC